MTEGILHFLNTLLIRILCLKDYHIHTIFQNIFSRFFLRSNSIAKVSRLDLQKLLIKLFIPLSLCYTMLVLLRGNNHDQKRRSYRISGQIY